MVGVVKTTYIKTSFNPNYRKIKNNSSYDTTNNSVFFTTETKTVGYEKKNKLEQNCLRQSLFLSNFTKSFNNVNNIKTFNGFKNKLNYCINLNFKKCLKSTRTNYLTRTNRFHARVHNYFFNLLQQKLNKDLFSRNKSKRLRLLSTKHKLNEIETFVKLFHSLMLNTVKFFFTKKHQIQFVPMSRRFNNTNNLTSTTYPYTNFRKLSKSSSRLSV